MYGRRCLVTGCRGVMHPEVRAGGRLLVEWSWAAADAIRPGPAFSHAGPPQVSDTALYTQLTFYEYIFDVDHHLKKLADAPAGAPAGLGLPTASRGTDAPTAPRVLHWPFDRRGQARARGAAAVRGGLGARQGSGRAVPGPQRAPVRPPERPLPSCKILSTCTVGLFFTKTVLLLRPLRLLAAVRQRRQRDGEHGAPRRVVAVGRERRRRDAQRHGDAHQVDGGVAHARRRRRRARRQVADHVQVNLSGDRGTRCRAATS